MAEETNAQTTQTEADQPEATETDWKAKYESMRKHARDWEAKAKANQGAADELEQLRAASMTEQEKAIQRAEKAEAELAQMRSAAQKRTDADELSAQTGIPAALLMHCADREDMEAFAKEFLSETKVPTAPQGPQSRVVRDDGAKRTSAERFAEALGF